jgi:hypothetical protein
LAATGVTRNARLVNSLVITARAAVLVRKSIAVGVGHEPSSLRSNGHTRTLARLTQWSLVCSVDLRPLSLLQKCPDQVLVEDVALWLPAWRA